MFPAMPGYSRTLEPFSKFNCFMDTLTHNRNHQSLNEVVDLGAIGRTNGLELRVQHVVQLEANVLSVETHLCKFPGGLHLAHAGPVVALEMRAGSAQGWVWIGDVDVLAEIGSSSRKIADVVAGNDGLHGLALLSGIRSGLDNPYVINVGIEHPDRLDARVFCHAISNLPEGCEWNSRKPRQALHFCMPKSLKPLLNI